MATRISVGLYQKFMQNASISKNRYYLESARCISTGNTSKKPIATTGAGWGKPDEIARDDPAYFKVKDNLGFDNAQEAFKSKKNSELFRALMVFSLCSVKPIVDNNKQLMKLSRKVLGKTLFEQLMKATFYGQFVAGEDEVQIQPSIRCNMQYGVKSILDYSVEKDLSKEEAQKAEMDACVSENAEPEPEEKGPERKYKAHKEFGDRREDVIGARTYFYEDEHQCDINMENFIKGIDAASEFRTDESTGFSAIKVTALGRPQLLLQLSEVLMKVRAYFDILAQGNAGTTIQKKDFDRYLKRIHVGKEERDQWYTVLDIGQDGEIDLLDWHNLLEVNVNLAKLLRVPNMETSQFEPVCTALTDVETIQMKNMLKRINKVVKRAQEKDVRVMIDAEQSYFQSAINRLCMEMMRKYNKEKAVVFNTYQCYLKDTHNVIRTDLSLSKREDFYFGCKLVRGAYMDQERKRALALGYEDPVNPSFEATTEQYERVAKMVMNEMKEREKGKIAVMIASHNENSVRHIVNEMRNHGIRASDRVVCFGQLLGMCDQVSFTLGQAGYSVYKYVPYGPVEEVLPYLSRRAYENKGILKKVKKEKKLLRQELVRRIITGNWFYKPQPSQTVTSASTMQAHN